MRRVSRCALEDGFHNEDIEQVLHRPIETAAFPRSWPFTVEIGAEFRLLRP
jgi:hypothetical protein